ncbi:BTAD domain-containing putative transcriptional regulator [Streptomyces sp. NPDC051217]|uniref:BTAD domain-containing putative transcriptional regulator n=1 Tax=Streptomyces sp. NPDC051217 TaxID=3365644 RepID=UPI00379358E4
MQFRILGPIESLNNGQRMTLGGTKQRATLGYLLLSANRVVATSQLLDALWPVDDAPTSARKILQNAIWGLRRVLVPRHGAAGPAVVTQPPGYRLTVDPDDVDLYRFQRLVDAGRARLAEGESEPAALLLREALDLWRGPVLADLAETGIAWPELAAVENTRLDVMEDYFEAELACGRHSAVLGSLQTMAEDTALRERSCGQLMLALYRSGRQVDALNVYGRARRALVDELGLEPGRELQMLLQAILAQDASLNLPETLTVSTAPLGPPSSDPDVVVDLARADAPVRAEGAARSDAEADRAVSVPVADRPETADGAGRTAAVEAERRAVPAYPAAGPVQRRQVSVLLVGAQLVAETHAGSAEPVYDNDVDELFERVSRCVQECVERLGGTVTASIGSVSMVVFDSGDEGWGDAGCAVLAALAVRDGLDGLIEPGARPGSAGPALLSFRAAVATGEAAMRYSDAGESGGTPTIRGALLDRCHSLLSRAEAGRIQVCGSTRERTRAVIEYSPDGMGEGSVLGIRAGVMNIEAMPTMEREFEFGLLSELLERARHRAAPHLVTVLGEAGSGKTRFIAEFGKVIEEQAYLARFSVGPVSSSEGDGVSAVQVAVLSALCGIPPGGSRQEALAELEPTMRGLVGEDRVRGVLDYLIPLLDGSAPADGPVDQEARLIAWLCFLRQTVLDRPLVLVIDDLHRADDALLDFVSGLADRPGVPLLVVAAARPELLRRRADWGGGKGHFTSMTLQPLSDAAVDQLVDFAAAPAAPTSPRRSGPGPLAGVEGPPDENHRRFVVRALLSMRAPGPWPDAAQARGSVTDCPVACACRETAGGQTLLGRCSRPQTPSGSSASLSATPRDVREYSTRTCVAS